MLIQIRENIQFYLMIVVWIVAGALIGNAAIVVVIASMFLLASREHYAAILTGFWLILILSDSKTDALHFAQLSKKAIIVLLIFFLFLKRKVIFTGSNGIFNVFIPFFIWSIFMTLRNPVIEVSLQKTFSYIFLFLAIPVFAHRAMEMDQRAFFRTASFTIALYLLFGLSMSVVNYESVHIADRFMGFMGNPNGLGLMVFLFGIFFDTILRKDPEMISRNQKIFVWAIIILNLLLCGSRTSLFAFSIYMVFANIKALRGFIGFVVFLVLGVGYGYIINNIAPLVQKFGLENIIRLDNLEDGSGRFIAWNFAWQQIQKDFMLGKGFSYTEWIFGSNYKMLSRMGHLGNAHNSFLTFWLDTGLIGLVLFLIAFTLLFIRLAKVSSTAMPLLYAVLISSFFESWLTASLNPNTIALLLTMTVMMYASEKLGKTEDTDSLALETDV